MSSKPMPGFLLTVKSDNEKTGRMPVSMSPQWTCPKACPYNHGKGCYAAYGPMRIWWNICTKNSLKNKIRAFTSFCKRVSQLPEGIIWRHNQGGDLYPQKNFPNRIDYTSAFQLILANLGKKGFTYTHFPVIDQPGTSEEDIKVNRDCINKMNSTGFTVNVSANSPAHVDAIIDSGLEVPVSVTVPDVYKGVKSLKTPAGHTITICPAQTRDDMTCLKCRACMNPKRKAIIGFIAHGSGRKHCMEVFKDWEKGVPGK